MKKMSIKVEIPIIKDLSQLKETPEYIPINYPGYKYATLIHGVPVVIHENGQMLIIQNTTGKKRHELIKHINQLVKDGAVELREVDKEIHFIDNKMVCDIKKLLKEEK
jgi:TATA-box binding protein (TBP) (component of TFIID and TFIIIB)